MELMPAADTQCYTAQLVCMQILKIQYDKTAALHASCDACQSSCNTVKKLLLSLPLLLQLLSITFDFNANDSHGPVVAVVSILSKELIKIQVSANKLKQQQVCAPAVVEADNNCLQQYAAHLHVTTSGFSVQFTMQLKQSQTL